MHEPLSWTLRIRSLIQIRIEMNTTFEKSANTTDEWYTPKEIIDALGKFDLDPCAPVNPLWQTAEIMYNKNQDGLTKKWIGRVWLNPPYSRPLIEQFVKRLAEHATELHYSLIVVTQICFKISFLRKPRQ